MKCMCNMKPYSENTCTDGYRAELYNVFDLYICTYHFYCYNKGGYVTSRDIPAA